MNIILKLVCATSVLAIGAATAPVSANDILNPTDLMQEKPTEKPKDKPTKKPAEGDAEAKKADKKKAATDKSKKKPKKKPKFKKYSDVITEKAKTKKGVFITHHVDEKVYFELPLDQLKKEFVWLVKNSGIQTGKGTISNDIARAYVYFERRGDKIFLRSRDYSMPINEDKAIAYRLKQSNLDAIVAAFPIVTFGENKTPVIDVSSIFFGRVKKLAGRAKIDPKTSTVNAVKSFERNVEVKVLVNTTVKPTRPSPNRRAASSNSITFEYHHSIHALPETLMKPRHYDKRVGFFDGRYVQYDTDKNKVDQMRLIKRWRLEKKDPSAELSEPNKPITWYIDRGTPEEFVEAVREGIEFWEPAFEAAGFKNGIVAKMAPTVEEDPDWDAEDARYSVIRWVPSGIPNANGPHIADPRTGEIIEADVRMYHNVIKLLEEWYFAQAGATDPRAKKLPLPKDVMSDLVRFVVAHEVGHSIGLHHNFVGNSAYSIAQLRDPEFVAKNGVSSSIMDYARFNYVIQPEDGTSPIDYVAGPYDKFAIEWGYREFAGELSAKEEMPLLNKIADRQLNNPAYRWAAYLPGFNNDPRNLTEAIGDDPVEASILGIKNIERMMPTLVDSTTYEPGKAYAELENSYRVLLGQYRRYVGHNARQIAGVVYRNELTQDHAESDVFTPHAIDKQKASMKFLNDYAFNLPDFWKNEDVLKRIGHDQYIAMTSRIPAIALRAVFNPNRMDNQFRMMEAGKTVYTPMDIFSDAKGYVFTELKDRKPNVSTYRRNVQATFVNNLIAGVAPNTARSTKSDDYRALCRSMMVDLQNELTKVGTKNKATLSGMHFLNLAAKIEEALDTK